MTDASYCERERNVPRRAGDTMRSVGADAGKKILPATATLRPMELQRLPEKEDNEISK